MMLRHLTSQDSNSCTRVHELTNSQIQARAVFHSIPQKQTIQLETDLWCESDELHDLQHGSPHVFGSFEHFVVGVYGLSVRLLQNPETGNSLTYLFLFIYLETLCLYIHTIQ